MLHCTRQPLLSPFDSRRRVVPESMSPGIAKDRASSVSTIDTPENEVILESRGSVRSPEETSVSTMEIVDWRTVSGRLWKLSAVTALRRLALGGDALLLATEEGRSLAGGGLRLRIEVFRDRRLEEPVWSASLLWLLMNDRERLNAESTLKAVGGW